MAIVWPPTVTLPVRWAGGRAINSSALILIVLGPVPLLSDTTLIQLSLAVTFHGQPALVVRATSFGARSRTVNVRLLGETEYVHPDA